MKTLKFKTNINCNGCLQAVRPFLDRESSISSWEVDIDNAEKILTVRGEALDRERVLDAVRNAGYHIESVDENS